MYYDQPILLPLRAQTRPDLRNLSSRIETVQTRNAAPPKASAPREQKSRKPQSQFPPQEADSCLSTHCSQLDPKDYQDMVNSILRYQLSNCPSNNISPLWSIQEVLTRWTFESCWAWGDLHLICFYYFFLQSIILFKNLVWHTDNNLVSLKVSLWPTEVEGKAVLRYSRNFCRQQQRSSNSDWNLIQLRLRLYIQIEFVITHLNIYVLSYSTWSCIVRS